MKRFNTQDDVWIPIQGNILRGHVIGIHEDGEGQFSYDVALHVDIQAFESEVWIVRDVPDHLLVRSP